MGFISVIPRNIVIFPAYSSNQEESHAFHLEIIHFLAIYSEKKDRAQCDMEQLCTVNHSKSARII